jgi:hypothetical protein
MSKISEFLKKAVELTTVCVNAEQQRMNNNTRQLCRLKYLQGYLQGGKKYQELKGTHHDK